MKHLFAVLFVLTVCFSLNQTVNAAFPPAPNSTSVLILSSTVSGGLGSQEANAITLAGFTPVLCSQADWSLGTAAQFAAYRAVCFGDPTCVTGTAGITAAELNAAVWGSVVDGNVVIIGTDEVFHSGQGGNQLTQKAMAFVLADDPGQTKTGAYISLSCYYHFASAGTLIPILDAVSIPGSMSMTGGAFLGGGCYNNAHITATHPALTGLTDATLSNWNCSVHEAFDRWDSLNYQVLAIARDVAVNYIAPDGSQGIPYILARGATVISDITLSPENDTNCIIGPDHMLTATVTSNGVPVAGTSVTFTVISGPCAGVIGSSNTNGAGVATISYHCFTAGTDFIKATFVDALGNTQTSNIVRKTWNDCAGPVELSAFSYAINNKDVTLNWSTSSEINNSGFEIERSVGNNTWIKIGFVNGNGTTSNPSSYSFVDRNLNSGTYNYRLKQIDFNGNFEYFNLQTSVKIGTPSSIELMQNYPNPFNPSTKIDFEIPDMGFVKLFVYDNTGKQVATLINDYRAAGYYTTEFNAVNLPSGIYFYKLEFNTGGQNYTKVMKMSLIK